MQLTVDDEIFKAFPELVIGVVIAKDIDNTQTDKRTTALLNEQVEMVRNTWSHDQLAEDPKTGAWREAYRSFKAKPSRYRCSVENMYRMILDGVEFSSINTAVDIYNAISLKYRTPMGGDDINHTEGDIVLTFAQGDERFVPLNGSESTPPRQGEIIYRDDRDVLCRRWNWRECNKSKMTADSRNLCLVVEGLPPCSAAEVEQITTELSEQIERFCGGTTVAHLIDRHTHRVEI